MSLAFVADPLPTNLEVSVSVSLTGEVTTSPDTLTVPNQFDGTITWTLSGATFLNPAITFGGQNPPSFEVENQQTSTTRVFRWGNFNSTTEPYSFYYSLHVQQELTGERISHDPTVENLPPGT
jgi:hypothetical protein